MDRPKTFSPYQEAIFHHVEHGTGNGQADAVAGAGKTTTIIEAYERARKSPTGRRAVFLAFNRSIVQELKDRGVEAKTLNGLGYGSLLSALDFKPLLEGDKTRDLVYARLPIEDQKIYGSNIGKLIGLAKGIGLVPNSPRLAEKQLQPLTVDSNEVWYDLIDKYDIDLGDNPRADEDTLVEYARQVLTDSLLQMAVIDFDDQKYLPVVMGLPVRQFDWIFLDECQDLNLIDRELVRRALSRNGRLFAVGDPHQAIYGWRGADVDSFHKIGSEFNCARFPLSVCYRCPTSVVELAKTWVPHIEAAPGKQEGVVEYATGYDHTSFAAGDLVICRNNAPLISLAYRLMANRVPVVIMGRDFGRAIMTLVKKLGEKIPSGTDFAPTLVGKIKDYEQREVDKAMARRRETQAARIHDMCDAINAILEGTEVDSVHDIERELDSLFSDAARRNAVVLSTIHKAKGGQSEVVHILDWHLLPSRFAVSADAAQQEANLQYVAVTRAQERLRFISSDNFGKKAT